ncbi:MAG: hypothetical protein K8T91_13905 [Planctomycetes bacterium]|nr:hypothetical protein [Planctomycetota bacterium]
MNVPAPFAAPKAKFGEESGQEFLANLKKTPKYISDQRALMRVTLFLFTIL